MSPQSRKTGMVLLTSGLLAVGLALNCWAAPPSAAPAKKPKREPQRVSNMQLREGLHVLQATKKTLESADHDYGGHRMDAIKAIGAAEHQLRLALQSQHQPAKPGAKSGSGTGRPGAGGGGRKPETQAISNMQLADAIPILEQTRGLLEKADHDYGGHRAAAVRDLSGAIQQLKVALKYEKKVK